MLIIVIPSNYRLADKSMKLNVNVILGFQNIIGLLISLVSKDHQVLFTCLI